MLHSKDFKDLWARVLCSSCPLYLFPCQLCHSPPVDQMPPGRPCLGTTPICSPVATAHCTHLLLIISSLLVLYVLVLCYEFTANLSMLNTCLSAILYPVFSSLFLFLWFRLSACFWPGCLPCPFGHVYMFWTAFLLLICKPAFWI